MKLHLHELQAIKNKIARAENSAPAAAAATPVSAPPSGKYEDHSETALSFAAAGQELLGAGFEPALKAAVNYGSLFDITSLCDRLDAAVDKLPAADASRLSDRVLTLGRRKGAPTRAGEFRLVLNALPWVPEYLQRQRDLDRAAASIEIPEPLEGETAGAFSTRCERWEYSLPRDTVARIPQWRGWRVVSDEYEALCQQRQRARNLAEARRLADELRADLESVACAYEAAPVRGLDSLFLEVQPLWGLQASAREAGPEGAAVLDAFMADFFAYLGGHSIIFWERGHGQGVPPGGWGSLPVAALGPYIQREDVQAELLRRIGTVPPGHLPVWIHRRGSPIQMPRVVVGGIVRDWAGSYDWTQEFVARVLPADVVSGVCSVSSTPHPDGWWDGERVLTPAHYRALRLLQSLPSVPEGTGLDVRRAMPFWGRHEQAGWGRFLVPAYRCASVVAVDESLWARLDAIQVLRDTSVLPADAFRIPAFAEMRNGKMRISDRRNAPGGQICVFLKAHESSHGKHGRKGDVLFLHEANRAPACNPAGGSNGGGQYGSAVLAAIAADAPLLLQDGSGVALRAGVPVRVPGLAQPGGTWVSGQG